jgi:hypothetical protein
MRALASTLTGFLLIAVWSVALVSHAGGWLAWVDGGAGIVAVVAAFGFVRGRQRARRLMGMSGFAILVGSFLAVALGAPRWLHWTSFALACSSLLVALPGRSSSAERVRRPPAAA